MKSSYLRWFWRSLPKKMISAWVGKIAQKSFTKRLIPWYIKHFQIDVAPIKKPLDQFENLLDFFVREYRPEARPIAMEPDLMISPVDGRVSQIGQIQQGALFQAKGITYSLEDLLGKQQKYTKRFINGSFVTIYLSPRDYHRIHMPLTGKITESTYIPGQLYPVNEWGVKWIPGLFVVNERLVTYIETGLAAVALVKVGATNVGSIKVTYDSDVVTNRRGAPSLEHKVYSAPHTLRKGEEVGRFEFGSTIILLLEPDFAEWVTELKPGTPVQMGQPLARIKRKDG